MQTNTNLNYLICMADEKATKHNLSPTAKWISCYILNLSKCQKTLIILILPPCTVLYVCPEENIVKEKKLMARQNLERSGRQ